MLSSFKISKEKSAGTRHRIVLAGDIGATKTNLALFRSGGDKIFLLAETTYRSNDFKDIVELSEGFLEDLPVPDIICFGVAGPVLDGRATLSNIHWEIDKDALSKHFGVRDIRILNDLEATAYGLTMLNDEDLVLLHEGSEQATGNAAVIAPGTGLGEAGMYWDGRNYRPFATEGGHCDFAPRSDFDFELYTFLGKKFGHVSWERLLCGPGIMNIYHFLRDEKKREEPAWLKTEMDKADAAAVISRHAVGIDICRETIQLFIRYLAYESANLVLKFKATGGLYIGGGIIPQIIPLLQNNNFYASFCQSGRLNFLLQKVPVKVIMNTKTALLGAALYGSKNGNND